ncbi:hypothetical protein [Streptomyces sp. NPDC086787]|uniref:hypothetical protein n=1 Tax=Streptomyces sp. NPDC086787 TaxID=3365759 RepID=UPI00381E67BB
MSTTPQMNQQMGQPGQQFPSTAPQAQPYGMSGPLEQLQQLGQQQPYQQLAQQLGQQQTQQPYQQFGQQQTQLPYQQMGQQTGQHIGQQSHQTGQQIGQHIGQGEQQIQQQLQQITQTAIQQSAAQVLHAGVATGFIDIVQPLPGQPRQLFLRFPDGFRVLNNPTQQAHDRIQEAFALGHQVIGVWDGTSPAILRSVRVQKL